MFEIDLHAEVVALLGLDYVRAIFALENCLGAVLDKLREALDGDGDEDLGFGVWCGDVESDIVEVGDDLVDRGGC